MNNLTSQTNSPLRYGMLACLLASWTLLLADGGHYTRGIGKYPGRVSEYDGPSLVRDTSYRNIALRHTAFASGSEDYNLTAQLATDGIVSRGMPASVTVTANGGVLSLRDQAKTFDGNIHSYNIVEGEHCSIQYDWRGMEVETSRLTLNAIAVYYPDKAVRGYSIRVMASADGRTWKKIGESRSASLPGKATQQKISSDPNKQEATLLLPLREVKLAIPVMKGRYRHLRIEADMPGCAYWRFYENNFSDDERGMLPSYRFGSAWASKVVGSDADETQWLYVDFGDEADFDKVVFHWLQRPAKAVVQVSGDGQNWTDVKALDARGANHEVVACTGHGRFFRILMTKANASRQYVLSEMEVWGHGGLSAVAQPGRNAFVGSKLNLNRNWELCRDNDTQWVPATVPGTVLASYLNIGAVPDNTYANNMRQISESFFYSDFLYRTSFSLDRRLEQGERLFLNFDGINWKAVVKVNGKEVGRIDGAFVRGRFDITDHVARGENKIEVRIIKNDHVGAVKIKNEESTDLNGGVLGADNPTFHATIGWDWITSLPGRDMGIWNDVSLTSNRGVHVSDPYVTTTLNLPDTLATMTPVVRVTNDEARPMTAMVKGWIGSITFQKSVTLAAHESRDVTFLPTEFPQLNHQRMRLWWPNGYGEPHRYDAGFAVEGDTVRYKAGIRQMAYKDLSTDAKIYINGKRLVPLGGNWGFSEINLNYRAREYDQAVRFHRDMNFTMIRNWVGQIGDEEFYEACDKYGIMVWQDFWLANPWDGPEPAHEDMFMENARDLILKIRNHPSIGIYVGRNEGYPPQTLNTALREQVGLLHAQMEYIPSSADDGVSGHGPYRNMPVSWYFAHQTGKLHSERGVPNMPSYESVTRMLSPEGLWPVGEAWGQHDFTQKGAPSVSSFSAILNGYFGEPATARQFIEWGQWVNYDTHRAMYESSQQERKGLLIWMTHSCWPSMVWQTYDYYFEPTAAYFAIKKACEPLHLQYNAEKQTIEAVNMAAGSRVLQATAEYYDMHGKLMAKDTKDIRLDNDQTLMVMAARSREMGGQGVWFLRLKLYENGRQITENTYVQGEHEGEYAVLHAVPVVHVDSHFDYKRSGSEWRGKVTVTNQGEAPALMVRLNLKGSDGSQILPVMYSDNYFHLMPGESRTIDVSWQEEDTQGQEPRVEVTSFNDGRLL